MRWIGAFCPLLLGLAGLEVGKELSVLAHALVVVVLEEHDDLHLSLVAHLPNHGVVEQLTVLRDKYSEDSYGHEALHAIIVDMNGGEKYGS